MIVLSLLSPALMLVFIIFLFIKNWRNEVMKSNLKKFVVPMGMIFGTMGYSFRFFAETNDLSRYLAQVDNMSGQSFSEIIANDSEMLYVRDGLFYFANRCGNPYILPFIVGFVIYSIVFYVLFDMINRSKKTYRYSELLLLSLIMVGILAPLLIIGNVRCVLSYVIISFAVYRDTVQHKRNLWTFLLYIVPIGLHSSAIIIVAIRLMSIIFQKLDKMKWIILSIALFLPLIIDFSYEYLVASFSGPIGTIIANAINRAHWYLHWTSGGWATQVETSLSSNLVKVFGTIFLILMIILIFKRKNNGDNKDKKTGESLYAKPMISFLFLIAVFALGCLYIKTGAFWRFESVVVLFSPVIIVQAFDCGVLSKKYFHILCSYAVILTVYNVFYQLSNTDTTDTVIVFLTTPGIKIPYELLRGLIQLRG